MSQLGDATRRLRGLPKWAWYALPVGAALVWSLANFGLMLTLAGVLVLAYTFRTSLKDWK